MNHIYSILRALSATFALAVMIIGCSENKTEPGKGNEVLGWPETTMVTKPWTRWWWPASAVGKSDIDYMLDLYAEAGLGGMEVTTIYGAKGYEDQYIDYLSPEWMELFTYTLDGAGKRGLGIDLANASGWPFGGSWVKPEDACRYLASKTWTLSGGESLAEPIKYKEQPMVRTIGKKADISELSYPIATNPDLQQYAFEQVRYPLELPLLAVTAYGKDGSCLELTDRVGEDGSLDWTTPEGDWTVCAFFLGWHGKMVERAGPAGEGDVIDHFDSEALEHYLEYFDKAFEGYDVSGIRYYFNDSYEVDDAVGNSDWTEDFFNEFARRRGYDLKPYMPELLGLTDDAAKADRVVYDYRMTIGELLLEEYSIGWQKWAAAQGKGIRNQAHGSPANILDLYSVSDVPETEGRSIIGMKTASSAAHVCDKPLTSSESATWLNEHFRSNLGDVRNAIDTYLLSGVNHIFYHGTCMSPEDAQWPGWLFYAAVHFHPSNSFWEDFPAFNSYVTRCQSFLQAGKPDNDVLLFFNATDLLSERGREQMLYHMTQHTPQQSSIGESAGYLYERGYTWDYVSDRMLCGQLGVRKNRLTTPGGNSYAAIIVPKCEKMELETFKKLLELAKDGATVLVEESLPKDVPGLYELEARRNELASLQSGLNFTSDGAVNVAACGKGHIVVSGDLDAMLEYAGISRERMYDMGMNCISRSKDDGGKYYFVKNSSDESVSGWVPFDTEAGSAGIYNPMSGEYGFARLRRSNDGKTEIFMELAPDETMLVETFTKAYSGPVYEFYEAAGDPIAIEGEWTLEFVKGGPVIPISRQIGKLGSWTEYGADESHFSGTAEYSIELPETGISASCWSLDLGEVCESASVWLNGEYAGTVLNSPASILLDGEQVANGGKLTIRVSNSMANRIIYMDKSGIEWRKFYNANIQARLPEDRGADGYFTAAGWSYVPSGLIGPVTLTPMRTVEPVTEDGK